MREVEQVPDCIVADPQWHPGVVGLAAGRLVEHYHRPAVVIGMQEGLGVRLGGQPVAALPAHRASSSVWWLHAAAGLTLEAEARLGAARRAG